MIFKPDKEIVFSYLAKEHLKTTLSIKNTSNSSVIFKFNVSNRGMFIVKPREGSIAAGAQLNVLIAIHRDIVGQIQHESLQVLYGKEYQHNKLFNLVVQNGGPDDRLNLTVMVGEKESRIKQLENEVENYKSMPLKVQTKKEGNRLMKIVLVIVLGLIIGWYVPIRLFKKGW